MLEIEGIVTAYGKIEALKGVSLAAREGQITCLLGPNGAGKTTLMYSIAGILRPRRGSIRLAGAASPQVSRRLVAALLDLIEVAPADRRPPLQEQLELLRRQVDELERDASDRRRAVVPDAQGIGVVHQAPRPGQLTDVR